MKNYIRLKAASIVVFTLLIVLGSCTKTSEVVTPTYVNSSTPVSQEKSQNKTQSLAEELAGNPVFREYYQTAKDEWKTQKKSAKQVVDLLSYLGEFSKIKNLKTEDFKMLDKKMGFEDRSAFKKKKNDLHKKLMLSYIKKYDLKSLTDSTMLKQAFNIIDGKASPDNVKAQRMSNCDDIFLAYENMAQQDADIAEWAFKTAAFALGVYKTATFMIGWLSIRTGISAVVMGEYINILTMFTK